MHISQVFLLLPYIYFAHAHNIYRYVYVSVSIVINKYIYTEYFLNFRHFFTGYSKKLHPQNSSQVPVIHQDFSLVCNLDNSTFPSAKWLNQQGQIIAYFIRCYAVHEDSTNDKYVSPAPGRSLTCNKKDNTSTLTISPVEMSLDGTSVGCFVESRGKLYLYTFTVHGKK